MYRTVQQPSRLYEQIVEQIEASVVGGSLKPGDQLPPERELAERFGVSRTAVREAIKTLREKGLVEAFPGRGTFITNQTTQNMRGSLARIARTAQDEGLTHLVEVREILEPEIAARAAARRRRDADLTAMREAVSAMDAALDDADAFVEGDLDFHLALAEASANPIFLTLIDSIVGLLREQRSRISFVPGGAERGQFHHKRILAAVEAGDADAARDAMRDHMKQVREDSEAGARIQAETTQP
ncbi:MAG: FadR family transcriptional regulator [Acidobacteria bacterium]|nr:FadR family transcriptional regulator [Acidobacteriota bacterium]